MMGNDAANVRCSTNRTLPFNELRRELNVQLEMNGMSGVVTITRENSQTFVLGYRNFGGVKQTFQRVCDIVNTREAQKRGDWTAHYPPVEIQWL
jgi:hypothetical protein